MISLVINVDSRPQSTEAGAIGSGVTCNDLLVPTVQNKINFFKGFDIETILHIDEHNHVSTYTLGLLREMCDCVIVRKHSKHYRGIDNFGPFNDINYLQALSMARGEFIAHFDQDMIAFSHSQDQVNNLLWFVESNTYKYVSYPSSASPRCVDDPSFGDHIWASTRFFMCRKETINLTELEDAIWDNQAFYKKYGTPPRVHPWTEHFLGQACGYSVFYPPLSNDYLISPIHKYKEGVLDKLNKLPYDEIGNKLIAAGAHSYHGVELDRIIL